MNILLNGEPYEAQPQQTIAALVEQLSLGAKRYAVEVNQSIVPRSKHESYQLQDNDNVEVVVAIGGG